MQKKDFYFFGLAPTANFFTEIGKIASHIDYQDVSGKISIKKMTRARSRIFYIIYLSDPFFFKKTTTTRKDKTNNTLK